MGAILGPKYTGSITYETGDDGESRWIYVSDQAARTLAATVSGPSLPTQQNMIITDRNDFSALALHIRTVKTVNGEGDLTFTTREIYAWGGSNEAAHVRYSYDGTGAFGAVYINEGSQAAWDRIANMQTNKILIDNTNNPGYTVDTWIKLQGDDNSPLSVPLGFVGVHLHIVEGGAASIATVNTWTIEARYCYWV